MSSKMHSHKTDSDAQNRETKITEFVIQNSHLSEHKYDILLMLIPIALLVGATFGQFAGIGLSAGVAFGSLIGASVMSYGLFISPPK